MAESLVRSLGPPRHTSPACDTPPWRPDMPGARLVSCRLARLSPRGPGTHADRLARDHRTPGTPESRSAQRGSGCHDWQFSVSEWSSQAQRTAERESKRPPGHRLIGLWSVIPHPAHGQADQGVERPPARRRRSPPRSRFHDLRHVHATPPAEGRPPRPRRRPSTRARRSGHDAARLRPRVSRSAGRGRDRLRGPRRQR